jgi:alkaline phosphatase D
VRDDPDPAKGVPVLVDFVSAGISSTSFYTFVRQGAADTPLKNLLASPESFDAFLRGQNPDLAYADHDAQGFAMATVTADAFTVTFRKVKPLEAGAAPASPLAKRTRITLAAGSSTPVVEENV